jgi:hypothetical protein
MIRVYLAAAALSLVAPAAHGQVGPNPYPAAPADPWTRLLTPESVTGERGSEPGREPDEIETDRDSFTPATTTAGRGRLVTEFAYSFIDNRTVKETHSVP